MRTSNVPDPAVKRLSLYLRELEALLQAGQSRVSSQQLGRALGVPAAQVRKDLAYFGQFGHSGVGYQAEQLAARLRQILGTDRVWDVAVIGVGNLGRALLQYGGFLRKGFRFAAAFDASPAKIGQRIGEVVIQPIDQLPGAIQARGIRLAILAVPPEAAQPVCDQLVSAGVTGILNFAPVSLSTPPQVWVAAVDLAVQLEQLSFYLNAQKQG